MSVRRLPVRPLCRLVRAGARTRPLHATAARAEERPSPEKFRRVYEHAQADPKLRQLMDKLQSSPECMAAVMGLRAAMHSAMASKGIEAGQVENLGMWDKMKLMMDKNVREKGMEAMAAFKKADIKADMETVSALSKLSELGKGEPKDTAKKD